MTEEMTSSDVEYEFQPFERIFIKRLQDTRRLVHTAAYAMRAMDGLSHLSKALKKSDAEIKQAEALEALALAEAKADFPLLHSAGAVLVWGALESAVRDFLARWLVRHPQLLQGKEVSKLRVPIGDYEGLEKEERMRLLVSLMERDLAAPLKFGMGRFECLLHPLAVVPVVDDTMRRTICELAAVRNVIVHCASIVDDRFLRQCPWTSLKIGDELLVSDLQFRSYAASTSEFAATIVDAAEKYTASVAAA